MSYKAIRITVSVAFFGIVLGCAVHLAAGQNLQDLTRPRSVTKATSVYEVPDGQKVVLKGNVIKAEENRFSICDLKGAETVVLLTPKTSISTHRRGIFRSAAVRDKSYFLIGLNVKVEGRGNAEGQLVAKSVRFHDSDFRSETQVDARAIPIEREQVRQGGQLEETALVAAAAKKEAGRAQDSANHAQDTADLARSEAAVARGTAVNAHTRIAAIDDFELNDALTINFNAGSAKLTPESKTKLDEFAAKALSAKGFVIELSGFASKEGGMTYNHELSAWRAEAVMDYLVGVCNVPIRRIVVPYSGGEMNPVADNSTRLGRQQNRRVEVKMFISKGMAAKENVATSR